MQKCAIRSAASRFWPLLVAGLGLVASGCTTVIQRTGITLFYKQADLPAAQVRYDVPYGEGSSLPQKRLDLFLPQGQHWPVFVFVHGGGWNEGDKDSRAGGADVYGNIGRFYAGRGIGV